MRMKAKEGVGYVSRAWVAAGSCVTIADAAQLRLANYHKRSMIQSSATHAAQMTFRIFC